MRAFSFLESRARAQRGTRGTGVALRSEICESPGAGAQCGCRGTPQTHRVGEAVDQPGVEDDFDVDSGLPERRPYSRASSRKGSEPANREVGRRRAIGD